MLKRKSLKNNWEEAGSIAGIRSLLMLCSSCNDMSLYDSKKSMCLVGFFVSKTKRESPKNVTLPVRLQQLWSLHEKDHQDESEFLIMPCCAQ